MALFKNPLLNVLTEKQFKLLTETDLNSIYRLDEENIESGRTQEYIGAFPWITPAVSTKTGVSKRELEIIASQFGKETWTAAVSYNEALDYVDRTSKVIDLMQESNHQQIVFSKFQSIADELLPNVNLIRGISEVIGTAMEVGVEIPTQLLTVGQISDLESSLPHEVLAQLDRKRQFGELQLQYLLSQQGTVFPASGTSLYDFPGALFYYTVGTKFNPGFRYLNYELQALETAFQRGDLIFPVPEVNMVFYGASSLTNEIRAIIQFLEHNTEVRKLNIFDIDLSDEMSQQDVAEMNVQEVQKIFPDVEITYRHHQKNFFDLNFDEDIRSYGGHSAPTVVFALKNTLGTFSTEFQDNLAQLTFDNLKPGDKYVVGVSLWGDDTYYNHSRNGLFELLPLTLAGIPPFLFVRTTSQIGRFSNGQQKSVMLLSYGLEFDFCGLKKDTYLVIQGGERFEAHPSCLSRGVPELIKPFINNAQVYVTFENNEGHTPLYSVVVGTK